MHATGTSKIFSQRVSFLTITTTFIGYFHVRHGHNRGLSHDALLHLFLVLWDQDIVGLFLSRHYSLTGLFEIQELLIDFRLILQRHTGTKRNSAKQVCLSLYQQQKRFITCNISDISN